MKTHLSSDSGNSCIHFCIGTYDTRGVKSGIDMTVSCLTSCKCLSLYEEACGFCKCCWQKPAILWGEHRKQAVWNFTLPFLTRVKACCKLNSRVIINKLNVCHAHTLILWRFVCPHFIVIIPSLIVWHCGIVCISMCTEFEICIILQFVPLW